MNLNLISITIITTVPDSSKVRQFKGFLMNMVYANLISTKCLFRRKPTDINLNQVLNARVNVHFKGLDYFKMPFDGVYST